MKHLGSGRKHKNKSKKNKRASSSSPSPSISVFNPRRSVGVLKRIYEDAEEEKEEDLADAAVSPVRSHNSTVRKIQKFMRNTQRKRKEKFLKKVCINSGDCIALGKETNKIKEFFNGFTRFQYVMNNSIRRIGAVSVNGFINEIVYKKDDYLSRAILKSSKIEDSDNLMYEYMSGQYINDKCKKFPCFLETYGLYKYKNERSWALLRNTPPSTNILPDILELLPEIDLDIACRYSKYLAILIQHIENPITLSQALKHPDTKNQFFKKMLLPILFQIYAPLAIMKNEFTHYDLHLQNILLYQAPNEGYFECHYELPDSTEEDPHIIHFKTKYIPKIIDYGRSFFIKSAEENSQLIYDELCDTYSCDPYCGYDKGFGWLTTVPVPSENHYVNSSKRNISHDLRLLQNFKSQFKHTFRRLDEKLNQTIYSIKYEAEYGSPEVMQSGLPKHINNVQDAFLKFTELMEVESRKVENTGFYQDKLKIGDIFVYCNSDKNMEYIPNA
jgi:hypothetical protein